MRKRWIALAVLVALPTLAVIAVRFFVDEPLRRIVEQKVNRRLAGYTVHIRALRFHPLGFSLALLDSTIVQDAHPDPPVANLPRLSAGVHWRALLDGRLVADFLIDHPTLRLDLKQARKELSTKAPISERGWQDALQAVYPLKVNQFTVRDAAITYVDQGPFKPLRLTRVTFRAENIRNIRSKERVYPSDVHLEGIVFDSGTVLVDGHADFLAKPHPGLKAKFSLGQVELDYFKPIIRRYHVAVRNGTLSTDGQFEYAPSVKLADLQHVSIEGVEIEYVHQAKTEVAEKQVAQQVARSAKDLSNNPEVLLRVDKVSFRKSRFGFVNKAADQPYQLFLAQADLSLDNLSNQGAEGPAVGTLRGKFMGSGDTLITLSFQPKAESAKFDLKVQIREATMSALNDVLLAYGNFDVVEGLFSFYSELSVRNGEVSGYIKPLFRNMKVYDADQDRQKGFFRKVRERLIGALGWILENRPRKEVGTKVTINGKLGSPQFSTWEAVVGLLRNAFIKAITPSLEPKPGRHAS